MFRIISLIVLGVVVLSAAPVDAQLFRRLGRVARPTATYGQTYQRQMFQQPTLQRSGIFQQQAQRQLPGQQQSRFDPNVTPAAANNTQLSAAQRAAAQRALAQRGNLNLTRGQRYGVFFNPRTNQTILRPIRTLASPNDSLAVQPNSFRRPVAQPTVTPQAGTGPTTMKTQFDIARQALSAGAQPSGVNPTMNAPQTTLTTRPGVEPTPQVAPAVDRPGDTLTNLPNSAVETQLDSATTKKTFSILESGGPDKDDNDK